MTGRLRSTTIRWVILAATIALGLAITPHYGESWDERQFFKYADRALEAYSTWPRTGSIPLTGNTYDNYGPAYVMLTALGARLLGFVLPWTTSDLRHLIYFSTFVVGLWAFHRLCRRWLSGAAALGAALLFATQPVIWGHAFISPKDIPFLSFFLLTLVLGFNMVDSFAGLLEQARATPIPTRVLVLTGAWLAVSIGLILATPVVHARIDSLLQAAASGQTNILTGIATDVRTADPAIYVQKYFVLFLRARAALLLLLTGLLALLWWKTPNALGGFAAVAPAALALGFSTSIRVLGPFAALMVAAYAFRKHGRRALPLLLFYVVLGLLTMYATWPYLWPDALGHLVESVLVMSQYPWRGIVLFNGALYPSTGLPASYLPVLLSIQFTETAWPLILAGTAIAIFEVTRKRPDAADLLRLTLVWGALPLMGFIITGAPLYDNFRQVLFILPPLFLLAGVVFQKIKRLPMQAAVIALAILPGVFDGVRLHPYEYIYYNRFVGGVQGAFRKFELDYWGTSYREAAAYLAKSAPANASIWVEGPTHLLQEYARPDLKIYSTYEPERAEHYDYVVALTRFDLDLESYPEAPVVHTIERQGALLTVIKKP
ncbi:MAG: hypothetical protein V1755_12430 [Chloroflexota bacterium]